MSYGNKVYSIQYSVYRLFHKILGKQMKITQKTCDKLISPITIKLFPKCILCGTKTQVGHHFVHRSKSLILRYNFKYNIIPLCNSCHFKLHFNEGFWSAKIVQIKGLRWFKWLEKEKNKIIKPDYEKIYNRLKKMLSN
jgi:hypothetical protein